MKTRRKIEKGPGCLNCGQKLKDEDFCPSCGQKNDISRPTTGEMLSESLSNLFAFDGRLFHTLRNLFRHPGKVAEDFIHGKRMQYMPPVRLYFLSSIVLLFVFQVSDKGTDIVKIHETEPKPQQQVMQAQNDSLLLRAGLPEQVQLPEADKEPSSPFPRLNRMYHFYSKHHEVPADHALDSLGLQNSIWNHFLYTQTSKLENFDNEKFGEFFFSKIFWVLFLFLPILAMLLKLIYLRTPFYYTEHLFFTFYSQSAFFLMMALAYLLNLIPGLDTVHLLFLPAFAVFLFLAMRRFYHQGNRKTLGKFILLNILALPVFTVFFVTAALVAFILF